MGLDEALRELDLRVGLGDLTSEDQLESLLAIARQVEVPAGQILFEAGQPSSVIFQLVDGAVDVSGRVIERGLLGFADFVLARPYADTAVTKAPSRLLQVDTADYREYLEDNFELAYRIITRTSETVSAHLDPARLGSVASPGTVSFASVEIPIVERLMMFSRMRVFRNASMQALANLAQLATETRFAAGTEIVALGSRPSVVSFLVEGSVELAAPGGARAIRSARDLLAHAMELALDLEHDRRREDLIDLLEQHFDLTMALLGFLVTEQEAV
ncbi:MAG TPA: cyclic nucleotide-binding domain-containing protein [Kofleriaceae bacterium]